MRNLISLFVAISVLALLAGCATRPMVRGNHPAPVSQGKPVSPLSIQAVQEALAKLPAGQSAQGAFGGISVGQDEFFGDVACRAFRSSHGSGYACSQNKGKSGTWQSANRQSMIAKYGKSTELSASDLKRIAKRRAKWNPKPKKSVAVARKEPVQQTAPKQTAEHAVSRRHHVRRHRVPRTAFFTPWNGDSGNR